MEINYLRFLHSVIIPVRFCYTPWLSLAKRFFD